jgi:hypothetical protein
VVKGVWGVALFYYPSCLDLIKPSLLFLCNIVVINAFDEESPFLYLTRAGVEYCVQAVKRCLVLRFSGVIFFGPSGSLIQTLVGDEN